MTAPVQVLVDGGGGGVESDSESARTTLARAVAGTASTPRSVEVISGADGPRNDPHRHTGRVPTVDADAAVLVAPRRVPRRLSRGPVVDGHPVAPVQIDRPDDLTRTMLAPDPDAPWVVAAMARNAFLEPSEHWAARLRAGGHEVVDVCADRARRGDLVAGLRAGPRVVLCAGHERPRGWAGHRALRFRHLASDIAADGTPAADGTHTADVPTIAAGTTAVRAVGLVIAFACDTLARAHDQWPFGVRLVESGMVRAYLGPTSAVVTSDARALADIVVDILARDHPATVTDLVVAVDRVVAGRGQAAARRAWHTFRLVGAPDTRIA